MGWEWTLFFCRQAAVILQGHNNVSADANGLAKGSLRAAKHLGRLRMAVLFCKFVQWDAAHGVVLYIDVQVKYDRRYCSQSIPAILVARIPQVL